MQKPSLTMTRRLKAPPTKVFEAMTDPRKIALWFGAGAPESKDIEADAKVGGRYHFGFFGPTGERNDVMGVYREVEPVSRLVFSWYWKTTPERESLVTVDIQPDGEGAVLTLTHEQFFDETARDMHQFGWNYGLDNLVQALDGAPVAAA